MVVAGDGAVGAAIRGPPDQRVGRLATWCGAEFFFFCFNDKWYAGTICGWRGLNFLALGGANIVSIHTVDETSVGT